MEFFLAGAGVAAGFGVAARAHQRDSQRNQAVAQLRGFARREHEAGIGEHQPKRADQLDQFAVGNMRERLEFAGARAQPRQRNRQLRFPTVAQQVIGVRGDAQRFVPPVTQPEQRADAESPKARGVSALGRFQSPIEIPFRPGRVHLAVHHAVVSLLINHESVRSGLHQRPIIPGFQRPGFE